LLVLLMFAVTAVSLTHRLDSRNQVTAQSEAIQSLRQDMLEEMVERPVRLQKTR